MRIIYLSALLSLSLALAGCTADNPNLVADVDAGLADLLPPPGSCGDGVVDPGEQCDDGVVSNGTAGDGCTSTCTFVCSDDTACDDHDPCDGTETCTNHACAAGTALSDGADCGNGSICRAAACVPASCGDGIVTAPEECDDGNRTDGDGCNNDCTFSCVGTDQARNCTPTDTCAGQGACDNGSHVCAPGTPQKDGTACQPANHFCVAGVCTAATCGNSIVEPGEDCDHGSTNGTVGDGCNVACHFACVNPVTDCAAPPVCEKPSCGATHACSFVADDSVDGNACGSGLVCKAGACVAPSAVCGNGIKETGEDCDFGNARGPGTGCETNCKFSCSGDSCNDGNYCDGVESCGAVTVGGMMGQKCSTTAIPPNLTACGSGRLCVNKVCVMAYCGDGYVDGSGGETCDPPAPGTCDASCHIIKCGDGIRAGSEECDDGNTTNLDGCDANCKFEQVVRVDYLKLQYATDTYCTKNQLGSAFVSTLVQGQLQMALDTGVANGTINILFKLLGLDDLKGVSDAAVQLGLLAGTPATGTGYNGANLDWWYRTDPATIDAMRNPTVDINGSIAASVLTTLPASFNLTVSLAGVLTQLDLVGAKMTITNGAATKPAVSTGATPGHLPAEHLDPALVSFATAGQKTTTGAGKLCGNVTASSLQKIAAPTALVGCGLFNCSQCYTASNSLLDILVGGCGSVLGPLIASKQPDQTSTGKTYTLSENAAHVVTGCKDNTGAVVPLDACLAAASYSSFFKFTVGRVIAK